MIGKYWTASETESFGQWLEETRGRLHNVAAKSSSKSIRCRFLKRLLRMETLENCITWGNIKTTRAQDWLKV